ncbi:MAG: hypothetical protein HQL38_13405, partial [Alphaproteobacteria bacterium]|nr:hypothetical protein [Alphaproteobacteria bacterium]
LPAWLLDTRLEFTMTDHPQAPPFIVRLDGPLDDPRRNFDANQLQAWLVSKGMGRALGGKAGDIGKALQGALQRKPAPAAQQGGDQPPPPAAAPAPRVEQQILDGLLKGLTRQP